APARLERAQMRAGPDVPYGDVRVMSHHEPLAVGRERQRLDDFPGIDRRQPRAAAPVPDADHVALISAGGNQRSIPWQGERTDRAGMPMQLPQKRARAIPKLDHVLSADVLG